MARIRTIKPEFWTDEDMAEVSEAACLLAIGLLNYADDEGFFNANPKLIKAAVFPIREPSVTIPVMLRELSNQGYLTLFSTSDSKHFGLISNFAKHQVVNKPRPSKIRGLELLPYNYGSDTGGIPLGMDQGSGNGKVNPSLCENENSDIPSANHNSILDNRVPPAGGSSPLGKFQMFSEWMPEADFVQKAALWGKPIGKGYTAAELAEFVDYWKAEGKVFHQAQWEQKLAVSISVIRSRTSKSTKGGHHEQAAPAATSSGKSRARQKIEAAYEAKFGSPYMEAVGDDGGDLLGSVGSEERSGTVITLGAGDWQSQ
ncbi:DnaT-like ssDNA-binding domain-containing protein [Rahnella sp. AN3-3W3]|uniref:DnaT-like ssDNA-binding domain-containing protein n=1 Tax=Rahnella sp. AN3-3W3 TaxID=1610578 RepID=UPI000DD36276|nr:DnaT-like ssDNA-binding domain-containing protein [Rahnella sp. AN3-3W3]